MKVVWICHFSNGFIQSKIPLWKRTEEYASWIQNFAYGFFDFPGIQLHIISPHRYLRKYTTFTERNISYHFFTVGIPIFHRHWPGFFRADLKTNFYCNRKKILKLINLINPDIINLHGSENAYYSSVIPDLLKMRYKILISIQGFVKPLLKYIDNDELRIRIKYEELILKSGKYFGGEFDSFQYINNYNDNFKFFKFYYPVNEKLINETQNGTEKKYDCVYCGKLTKSKGIEDFIDMVSLIRNKHRNVRCCIVGPGNIEYVNFLKSKIKNFSLDENINMVGFVNDQKSLFSIISLSKVLVVPTFSDRLPSTIREAFFLKVPVVAYKTGGIPLININDEIIPLADVGDIIDLSEKTYNLLKNHDIYRKYSEKVYQFAMNEFSLSKNIEALISAYNLIYNAN